MEKIRNLSIRKSFFLYMGICILCSFVISAGGMRITQSIQNQIWLKYIDVSRYLDAINEGGEDYEALVARPVSADMSSADHAVSELCDFWQTYAMLFNSVIGSTIAIVLFYKNKLKTPLEQLKWASKKIADNDLDFQIIYENQDEMGELCSEFEKMRNQLVQNNQKLWKSVEEERVLRAAISHDIRSPLSVLKGYQEMLLEYVPDGAIPQEKEVEMLEESMKQIVRMDNFIDTMRKMNSLEGRMPKAEKITLKTLKDDIQAEIDIFAETGEKEIILQMEETALTFSGDKEMVLEVTENLISNALRYAKEKIKISLHLNGQQLLVYVIDDGTGFTEEEDRLTEAFFQKNAKDSLEHAGLGMYISRMYCEQHNGKLMIENHKDGGASVLASFGQIK